MNLFLKIALASIYIIIAVLPNFTAIKEHFHYLWFGVGVIYLVAPWPIGKSEKIGLLHFFLCGTAFAIQVLIISIMLTNPSDWNDRLNLFGFKFNFFMAIGVSALFPFIMVAYSVFYMKKMKRFVDQKRRELEIERKEAQRKLKEEMLKKAQK